MKNRRVLINASVNLLFIVVLTEARFPPARFDRLKIARGPRSAASERAVRQGDRSLHVSKHKRFRHAIDGTVPLEAHLRGSDTEPISGCRTPPTLERARSPRG